MSPKLKPLSKTILVVEGEPLLLKFLSLTLTKSGFTVLSAASEDEAIRTEAGYLGKIHLLLISMTMPTGCGIDLAKKLGRRRPGLPILLMSGYQDGATVAANNGWRFISKPFDRIALLDRIEAFATAA
jgi:two-component system, NtrC family, response regulator GlrR